LKSYYWERFKFTLTSCWIDSISWVDTAISSSVTDALAGVWINNVIGGALNQRTFAEAALGIDFLYTRAILRDAFTFASSSVNCQKRVKPAISVDVADAFALFRVENVVLLASDCARFFYSSFILSRCYLKRSSNSLELLTFQRFLPKVTK
jgi:hypothetical protein